jgi:hypothetical protein
MQQVVNKLIYWVGYVNLDSKKDYTNNYELEPAWHVAIVRVVDVGVNQSGKEPFTPLCPGALYTGA